MTTRRWYYLIPATGQPRGLVHAIERHNLDALPGERVVYAGRQQLDAGLTQLLVGSARRSRWNTRRCAPFPTCRGWMPGRLEMVRAEASRSFRPAISSNSSRRHGRANSWRPIGRRRRRCIASRIGRSRRPPQAIARGRSLTEYDLQQQMMRLVRGGGAGHAIRHRSSRSAAMPETRITCRRLTVPGRLSPTRSCLLDLWGKKQDKGAVFADITWVAVTATRVPAEVARAFHAVADARDAAVTSGRGRRARRSGPARMGSR